MLENTKKGETYIEIIESGLKGRGNVEEWEERKVLASVGKCENKLFCKYLGVCYEGKSASFTKANLLFGKWSNEKEE